MGHDYSTLNKRKSYFLQKILAKANIINTLHSSDI